MAFIFLSGFVSAAYFLLAAHIRSEGFGNIDAAVGIEVVFKERYRREHESELIVFSAAEKYIKKHYKDGKPPLIRELRAEQKALLAEKDKLYKDYYSAKCEMSELQTIKKNVDTILGKNKEQEQSRNKKRSGELE